jgi:hypothetical protein
MDGTIRIRKETIFSVILLILSALVNSPRLQTDPTPSPARSSPARVRDVIMRLVSFDIRPTPTDPADR